MSINEGYEMFIEKYAETHFIKSFSKCYGAAWDETLTIIGGMLQYVDRLLLTSKAEKIHSTKHLHLLKCEFAIAGLNQSPHASGNRYIVLLDEQIKKCSILLLYAKTDVKGTHETQWRQSEIKKNYSELKKIFTGL